VSVFDDWKLCGGIVIDSVAQLQPSMRNDAGTRTERTRSSISCGRRRTLQRCNRIDTRWHLLPYKGATRLGRAGLSLQG